VSLGLKVDVFADVMPLGQTCCMRLYGGASHDQFLSKLALPFPCMGYLAADGTWGFFGNGRYNNFEANYVAGFNIGGGFNFRPRVYHPTTDTFSTVTAVRRIARPAWVHRRRFRQRKVGHTVTAPLNWGVAGHW
jgi:hypothetical protein